MNDELSIEQAERLRSVITKKGSITSVECLAELALTFADIFLEETIKELKERQPKKGGGK